MIPRRVVCLFIQMLKYSLDSRFPRFRFRSQCLPEQRIQHLHVCFLEAFIILVFL
jgi:hypothetical protein